MHYWVVFPHGTVLNNHYFTRSSPTEIKKNVMKLHTKRTWGSNELQYNFAVVYWMIGLDDTIQKKGSEKDGNDSISVEA